MASIKVRIAQCTLNQSAIDFQGNHRRIVASIMKAREMGCKYRTCQEMEISSHSCDDHFKELDTIHHSWEVLQKILSDPILTKDMIVESSMAVLHRGSFYNCKIVMLNQRIILVRPKLVMADGDVFRETRYFTFFIPQNGEFLERLFLPASIQAIIG